MHPEPLQKSRTILVVEDEIAIRQLVVGSLRKDGFRVLEANNPHDAAEMIGSDLFQIDLLIADICMPLMTGEVFAKEMLAMRPNLRIIFATGSSLDELRDSLKAIPHQVFLQKPYTSEAIRDAVRHALAI